MGTNHGFFHSVTGLPHHGRRLALAAPEKHREFNLIGLVALRSARRPLGCRNALAAAPDPCQAPQQP